MIDATKVEHGQGVVVHIDHPVKADFPARASAAENASQLFRVDENITRGHRLVIRVPHARENQISIFERQLTPEQRQDVLTGENKR